MTEQELATKELARRHCEGLRFLAQTIDPEAWKEGQACSAGASNCTCRQDKALEAAGRVMDLLMRHD